MGDHGPYLPEGVEWKRVDGSNDHHRAFLWIVKPGNVRRTRILLGDLRRSYTDRKGAFEARYWRAFPVGVTEFPEVFGTHIAGLRYLKERWEARSVVTEPPRREARAPDPDGWVRFAGADPFAE